MAKLFHIIFALLTGIPQSWLAWQYWGWFVLPLGAPDITWLHMWGLLCLAGLTQVSTNPVKNWMENAWLEEQGIDGTERAIRSTLDMALFWGSLTPLLWAVGWSIHHFSGL